MYVPSLARFCFLPFGPSEADYAVKEDQSNTKAVCFASVYSVLYVLVLTRYKRCGT